MEGLWTEGGSNQRLGGRAMRYCLLLACLRMFQTETWSHPCLRYSYFTVQPKIGPRRGKKRSVRFIPYQIRSQGVPKVWSLDTVYVVVVYSHSAHCAHLRQSPILLVVSEQGDQMKVYWLTVLHRAPWKYSVSFKITGWHLENSAHE